MCYCLQSFKDEAEKLKNEGNIFFKDGEYMKAISLYTQGLQTCPLMYSKERAILYSNRAAAKIKCLVRILYSFSFLFYLTYIKLIYRLPL